MNNYALIAIVAGSACFLFGVVSVYWPKLTRRRVDRFSIEDARDAWYTLAVFLQEIIDDPVDDQVNESLERLRTVIANESLKYPGGKR